MDEAEFATGLRELTADRMRGASELARQSLALCARSARATPAASADALRGLLERRAAALVAARPSMAPIGNLLARWRDALGPVAGDELSMLRHRAEAAAQELIESSQQALGRAAAAAAKQIGDGKTIITHSLSASVSEALHRLRGRSTRVIVTESRPLLEGHTLARKLVQWGLGTTLITDAEVGLFVAEADVALVGADSLCADGSVVNKVGTYLLALAARDRGIPFYVCCESFKLRMLGMPPVELEEMDPGELAAPELGDLRVRNCYFDITPSRLVSGWIDEQGQRTRWEANDPEPCGGHFPT
jgi:translation initiation factor 2B subunit (eIF-2B alpha/beta/delta family)